MTSKRQRQQRNAARVASNEVFKKKQLELASAQSQIDDDKLSTTNTSDTEGEEVWFWNESANETNSDTKEEGENVDLEDVEESRTEQAVSSKVCKTQIRWNKKGEDKLRGAYGKESRRIQMRHQKSAHKLQKEASKTYNIQAL